VAGAVLLAFGVISAAVLVSVGLARAVRGRYRDRAGTVLEGGPAVRAGLLVALVGACELAVTVLLWAVSR
jgi:hypothetical protein